jgi:uncharacterized damage-inducible protein DinB
MLGGAAEQLHARPADLPSVSFQLRHIAGSVDRLLTYAEGHQLSDAQFAALKAETRGIGTAKEILGEIDLEIARAGQRVRSLASQDASEPRTVGTKRLPVTLGGLLVHIAEHTQRHVGQAITTAKLVSAPKAL